MIGDKIALFHIIGFCEILDKLNLCVVCVKMANIFVYPRFFNQTEILAVNSLFIVVN